MRCFYAVVWLLVPVALSICVALAADADGVIVRTPELAVVRHGVNVSVSLPGTGYREFVVGDTEATYFIDGADLGSSARRIPGPDVSRVAWEPAGEATKVTITFTSPPQYSSINATGGTELKPGVPQVLAGFGFTAQGAGETQAYPVAGGFNPGEGPAGPDPHGGYELPKFPETKYSDALVTLKVQNVDFRDVLWLLSDIGGISIVLDPYWNVEPTGVRRPPGGGASGNPGGGAGGGGYRGAGNYYPPTPREGTGNLSLSFDNVPFDMALDLVLMSVGLVKVDLWPGQPY